MDYHLAIDLGASSGRCIVGYKKGAKIKAEEIHRFRGYLKTTEDGLVWDIDYVFAEIKKGISLALKWYPDLKTLVHRLFSKH